MRALLKSDFFLRFVGGFALGVVALVGMQPEAVKTNLGLIQSEVERIG
jgi:hypothetical protein